MKREIYNRLIQWKESRYRKPLIMYGARQVGKTYIIKEFGNQEFENMVYVNCYKNEVIATLFQGDANVERLLVGLSAFAHQTITPGKTLLFLDEIQEIPPVISSLKYFCENKPELHVVVAGSLLGVMNMKGQSYPVGKVDMMHLYPMSFEEFLVANGEEQMQQLLLRDDHELVNILSGKFIELLRQYYFVGGMPEAVLHFSQHRDPVGVRRIQQNILAAYEADISKHTASETQRVRMVWQSIPAQLARENKKFIYGAVRKGARAKDFEIAIQWLIDAGLVHKVERTRDVKLPLKFYADVDAFKLYMLDVGLLGAMAQAPADQMLIGDSVFSEYKGAFTENFVLQELKTIAHLPLYYYSKENSTQEVDFIAQAGSKILPIEVKAEENVKSKSLHAFINNDFAALHLKGIRFSMLGYKDQEWMENVPLYAARVFCQRAVALEEQFSM
ncbi:MAG: ATP-binding protein [Bacteroidales bacterium]|nr:ATP-binding protein [Bacteroidales bacterium]